MLCLLSLFLLSGEASAAELTYGCENIPGTLKQLDASGGEVYGVNFEGFVYRFSNSYWTPIPGKLKHVTVGPAGVWGISDENIIYKIQNNTWPSVTGFHLMQVDAGSNFLSGVNENHNTFCLTMSCPKSLSIYITIFNLPDHLRYYSCGPLGCWGVGMNNKIFYRANSNTTYCQGTDWVGTAGSDMLMVEVGTDGSVYALDNKGDVYKRDGISSNVPAGTTWTKVNTCCQSSHISYDNRTLWLIGTDGQIYKCPQ